jgi:hypothetical protein
MTDHDKAIIRVLQKQLDRTDRHRATGQQRIADQQLINEIKNKYNGGDNDSAGNIQNAPEKDDRGTT